MSVPSLLDQQQILQRVFNESSSSLQTLTNISAATIVGGQFEIIINESEDSVAIYGNDGSTNRIVKTDVEGNLQVDVLTLPNSTVTVNNFPSNQLINGTVAINSLPLPTGAATSSNQTTEITSLQIIDDIVLTEDTAHNSGDKGVMVLSVRQDSSSALASNGDYQPFSTDSNGRVYSREVPDRPSQGSNRTHITANVHNVTSTTTIYTVTSNKTFYLMGYSLSGVNTNLATQGQIVIRDDTTNKIPFILPVGVTGGSSGSISNSGTLIEPLPFTTNVSLAILAGSINGSCFIIGYEE